MGWGQLTDSGKLQAYNVGKFLRARYNSFLGDVFYPEIVLAQSTDFDRTKMTALLILAGLFEPSPAQTWKKDLAWLPIPVAYKEENLDYFLRRPNSYCPAYYEELQRVLNSQEVQNYMKSKENLLTYLSTHTGKSITSTSDVFGIFQTLTAENTMNLPLPEWSKSVFPGEVGEIARKRYRLENSTPLLRKLNGGRSLQRVLENILAKTRNRLSAENRKIFLYSGHENNIINILTSLGWDVSEFPNYSSTVIFELHFLKETDEFAVKVLYSTEPGTIEEKQIKGCEVLCPLKKFVELTKNVIPRNYTAECRSLISLD
ncbi:venom acid phosphatase Acph-1 isoform X2 [Leptinotarsa decemlineata]